MTALARALVTGRESRSVPVAVLADGAFGEITGRSQDAATTGDAAFPEKALAVGACRVISQELPELRCAVLDPDLYDAPTAQTVDELLAELGAGLPDPQVVWRKGRRYLPGVTALPPAPPMALPEGRVALLTGGLGGLGSRFAETLIGLGFDRLALLNRRPLPAPETWETYLSDTDVADLDGADTDTSRTVQAIRRVRRLEAMGAEVLVLEADVADRRALAEAFAPVEQRWSASPAADGGSPRSLLQGFVLVPRALLASLSFA